MRKEISVKCATGEALNACYRIRHEVFVVEQKVPEELERDDYDAESLHFIATEGSKPVATARVLLKDSGKTAKIGRVAVLESARGLGIGKLLMESIEQASELREVTCFALDSQTHASPFYEKLGYQSYGDEFMDAGIPHFHMRKLSTRSL